MLEIAIGVLSELLSPEALEDILVKHPLNFIVWTALSFALGFFAGNRIARIVVGPKLAEADERLKESDANRRSAEEKLTEADARLKEAKARLTEAETRLKETNTLRLSDLPEQQQSVLQSIYDDPNTPHVIDANVLQLVKLGLVADAQGYDLIPSDSTYKLILTVRGNQLLSGERVPSKEADNA